MEQKIKILSLITLLWVSWFVQASDEFDKHRPDDVGDKQWSSLKMAVQEAKFLPQPAGIGGGNFGKAVYVDGDRALVGGPSMGSTGAALVLEFDGINWQQVAVLRPADGAEGDKFGNSVSLSGDRALVGAYLDDDNGSASGSAYVFDYDGINWSQSAKLTAGDATAGDDFGNSVSLSGDRALVGASGDDDNGNSSGSAYVFDYDGMSWSQSAKLTASDGANSNRFGYSVSLSDDRALVGAYSDDDNGNSSGSAYVFDYDGMSWNQSSKLTAGDGATGDWFGYSVSLSGDRSLVGARLDDDHGSASGSAYVFDYDGINWSQSAKLTAGDAAADDSFGISVSLSGDRALVGAYFDNDNGIYLGSAYVFDYDGMNWNQSAKLIAGDGAANDFFGNSVSLSGNRALVGAYQDDDNGSNSGSAYVFDYNGMSWNQNAKLTAGDAATSDWFGYSVSLSGDRALVGAMRDNDNGIDSGSAYVFDYDGMSWSQSAKLTADDSAAFDNFGVSVSLSDDRALVGAYSDDDNGGNSGSVYVFDYDGMSWNQSAKLTAGDATAGDDFGNSVSLSGDRALVGAYADDDNGNSSGSAYVFDYDGMSWNKSVKLTASDAAAFDRFGYSVSLSGDRVLVGAYRDDDNGSDSGSAYVFDYDGMSWYQSTKLTAGDAAAGDYFGYSVSLSVDRALVGAYRDDANGNISGSAYVFDYDGMNWGQSAKLTASDGAMGDQFGWSVSLSVDQALVGAYTDNDKGSDSGSAYVFNYNGMNWSQSTKLTAGDGASFDLFGYSVSLSGDRALVGAVLDDDHGTDSGSAYVINCEFDYDLIFRDGFDFPIGKSQVLWDLGK